MRTLIEIFHKQTLFDNKWGKNEYYLRSMISYFFGGYYVMCTLEFINVRLVRYAYKFNQIKVNHTVIYNILTRKNNIRIYNVSFGFPFFIIFTSSIGPIWWESPCKYIFPFLVFGQASIIFIWFTTNFDSID